jgi:hypothetical protein
MGRRTKMSPERFRERAAELRFTEGVYRALFPVWVEGRTFEETAAEVKMKPGALRVLSSRMDEKGALYDENRAKDAEREVNDAGKARQHRRAAAKVLQECVEGNRTGTPPRPLDPVDGDRDRVKAKRLTTEDYEAVVAGDPDFWCEPVET